MIQNILKFCSRVKFLRYVRIIPFGYRIEKTLSHWDSGLHVTYIAYKIVPGAKWPSDDWQLGSYRNFAPAAASCWSDYRLQRRWEHELKTNKLLRDYVDGATNQIDA